MIHKDDQETWDGLVSQCGDGSFSSINVASWKRSRAIMNIVTELRALRRKVGLLWRHPSDQDLTPSLRILTTMMSKDSDRSRSPAAGSWGGEQTKEAE